MTFNYFRNELLGDCFADGDGCCASVKTLQTEGYNYINVLITDCFQLMYKNSTGVFYNTN